MTTDTDRDRQRLVSAFEPYQCVVVALSGGVDSSVVAAAAARAAGHSIDGIKRRAVAVTAQSPSVPRWQLDIAQRIAAEIGIEHHLLPTTETELDAYRRNDQNRCFFCKDTLYRALVRFAETFDQPVVIASGTNADDLGDFRPGIAAGDRIGVIKPLAELGFGKNDVRRLAASFRLSNCDLPASPCLASRIAYGTEVTVDRLAMIERAESWLRSHGFHELRVRLHADELARIEVPQEAIGELIDLDREQRLTTAFRQIGFRYITVDMQGLQSGSMNRVLVPLSGIPSDETSNGSGKISNTTEATAGKQETTI